MTILRITVRTFQNEDHANMFLLMSQNINEKIHESNLNVTSWLPIYPYASKIVNSLGI